MLLPLTWCCLWCPLIPRQGTWAQGIDKSPRESKQIIFLVGLICWQPPVWSCECGWKQLMRGKEDLPVLMVESCWFSRTVRWEHTCSWLVWNYLFQRNRSYTLTFHVSVPGDRLCSYTPVSSETGHPDKAEDKNPHLTLCANALTYACLADFTGRLFYHYFPVLDCSSIILLNLLWQRYQTLPKQAGCVCLRQNPLQG